MLVLQPEIVQKSANLVAYCASENPLAYQWIFTGRTDRNVSEGKENVKRKYLINSILLVTAALVFAGLAPLQAQRNDKPLITVLNPAIASKMVDREPLSPRLDTLEGKTLYLVDINWGGPEAAYSVFEEMADWFKQYMPTVKVVIKRKTGMYSQDDPALWKEIAEKGNAALIGISG
jgi:hypothetical protein